MDETRNLLERIIRATERGRIKGEYGKEDLNIIAETKIGCVRVFLEPSYTDLKVESRMELRIEPPGRHMAIVYLWNYENEVRPLSAQSREIPILIFSKNLRS